MQVTYTRSLVIRLAILESMVRFPSMSNAYQEYKIFRRVHSQFQILNFHEMQNFLCGIFEFFIETINSK